MARRLKSYPLTNGLLVEILDDTRRYYADFHNVKITIRVKVPVREEWLAPFRDGPHYAATVKRLLPGVTYVRKIVKAGIEGKRLAAVKEQVVDSFEKNALPYFERDDFPERYALERFRAVEEKYSSAARRRAHKGAFSRH